MRRQHVAATLLLVLAMVSAAFSTGYGVSSSFKGKCQFTGDAITSDYDSESFAASIADMEPGDELNYLVTYTNNGSHTTEWYMLNAVISTLEESADQAENGGYTYVLTNIGPDGKETVIFDNSEVGGEAKVADLEGLKQATNATGEYFFIQELKPGESGQTKLYVQMDGETEVNDYMDTKGSLMLTYAVEEETDGTGGQPPTSSHPDTGDQGGLLRYIIINAAAVALLLIAILSWRKDRKARREGEEA